MSEQEQKNQTSLPPRPVALSRPGPKLRQVVSSRRPSGAVKLELHTPRSVPPPPAPSVPKETEEEMEVDYRAIFRMEVGEILQEIDQQFASWPQSGSLERIVRGFHTLAGSARSLGLEDVGTLAARLEKSARDCHEERIPPVEERRIEFRAGCVEIAGLMQLDFQPAAWTRVERPGQPVFSEMLADLDGWSAGDVTAGERLARNVALSRNVGEELLPVALGNSLEQLGDFLQEWGSSPPTAEAYAVLQRCLKDARDYLDKPAETRPPWRRRWGLYFNSLRVALATQRPTGDQTGGRLAPDPEMLQAFMEEAGGLFELIEHAALRWERREDAPGAAAELRRHFHTLKGAANSVGLTRLGTAYHEWEERMEQVADAPVPPEGLLAFNDRVRGYLDALRLDPSTPWEDAHVPPKKAPVVDPELLEAFIEEGQQLLDPIETALMSWERGENSADREAELRRHFHTLKGAANSIGLKSLGEDFHFLEEKMQQNATEEERAHGIPLILTCMDETRRYLLALAADPSAAWGGDWPSRFQQAALTTSPSSVGASSAVEKNAIRVEAERVRQLLDQSGEMVAGLSRFENLPREIFSLRRQVECLRGDLIRQYEEARMGGKVDPEVLLEWDKACAVLSRGLSHVEQTLGKSQESALRRARQLQKDLAGLNMGPVSSLFRRLQRVFRDALQEEGKEAELHTEGGQTRLDRAVLDRLYGPLLHIVRNAVAHGIESPGLRLARGKPPTGSVRLTAVPHSDHVRIEVTDDGAGIDASAVRQRAVERGLLAENAPDLSDEEIIRLLFTPGFSTKEKVSSVAGRGVGLDVVKEEIEGMNGSVAVRFTAGQGAVWSIRVPLNLSASEGLLIRAGNLHAALPLSYVVCCHRLKLADFESRHGRLVLALNGLPYFALHEVLGSSAGEDPTHGIEVDAGAVRAVLGVHAILARREMVCLDPGPMLRRLPVLSAVTTEADGTLIPVLQIPQMLRRLTGPDLPAAVRKDNRFFHVLLVDDSSSVRLAHRVLLEKIGWTVETVAGGREALEKLREGRYDLVLSDLEMPDLDGRALLRAIRADAALAHAPVIIVTSRRESAIMQTLAEAGADAVLSKPLDVTQLMGAVSRLEPRGPKS